VTRVTHHQGALNPLGRLLTVVCELHSMTDAADESTESGRTVLWHFLIGSRNSCTMGATEWSDSLADTVATERFGATVARHRRRSDRTGDNYRTCSAPHRSSSILASHHAGNELDSHTSTKSICNHSLLAGNTKLQNTVYYSIVKSWPVGALVNLPQSYLNQLTSPTPLRGVLTACSAKLHGN
jgi:hypothetical protein